jgi:hypothetical protein
MSTTRPVPSVGESAAAPARPGAVARKGLRAGVIGLLGSTVLGVVQTAPA